MTKSLVIADESQGWALEVAEKMEIRRAAFWPAAAALLALEFSIPKLIQDGIIHNNGEILCHYLLTILQYHDINALTSPTSDYKVKFRLLRVVKFEI